MKTTAAEAICAIIFGEICYFGWQADLRVLSFIIGKSKEVITRNKRFKPFIFIFLQIRLGIL